MAVGQNRRYLFGDYPPKVVLKAFGMFTGVPGFWPIAICGGRCEDDSIFIIASNTEVLALIMKSNLKANTRGWNEWAKKLKRYLTRCISYQQCVILFWSEFWHLGDRVINIIRNDSATATMLSHCWRLLIGSQRVTLLKAVVLKTKK